LTVSTVTLRHVRVELALHQLSEGDGRPLLLLHGLGERSPESVPQWASAWPGPVHGLDFTGHGESTVPAGGGYTAEALMGDADAALAHLGSATVLGRGLGAYIALLIAGARPDLVRGAVLTDGPGLAGGGPVPGSPNVLRLDRSAPGPPDPFALAELSRDVRPPDYAAAFVFQAVNRSELSEPIAVSGHSRPEWLRAVVDSPGVRVLPVDDALALYGRS